MTTRSGLARYGFLALTALAIAGCSPDRAGAPISPPPRLTRPNADLGNLTTTPVIFDKPSLITQVRSIFNAGYLAPATFAYEDVVFNPAFGHVAVTDQPKEREIGAKWSAKGQAWIASIPSGREPFAAVQLQAQPKAATPFLIGLRELQAHLDRATGNGTR